MSLPYGVSFTLTYTAWDTGAGAPKTGDVANHTLRLVKDGTAAAPINAPAEIDATNAPGAYKIVGTATEAQALVQSLVGKSSTADVVIIPTSVSFVRLPNVAPGASGGLPTVDASNRVTANVDQWKGTTAPAMTGDAFARLGAPAGASVSADVAGVAERTGNLPDDPADASLMLAAINELNEAVDALALLTSSDVVTAAGTAITNYGAAKTSQLPAAPDNAKIGTTSNAVGALTTALGLVKSVTDALSPRVPTGGTLAVATDIPASSITAIKSVTDSLSPRLPGAGTLAIAGDIPAAPDNSSITAIKAVTDFLSPRLPGSGTIAVATDIPAAPDNDGIAAVKIVTDALAPRVPTTGIIAIAADVSGGSGGADAATIAAAVLAAATTTPIAASLEAVNGVAGPLVLLTSSDVVTAAGTALTDYATAKTTDLPAAPDNASIAAVKIVTDLISPRLPSAGTLAVVADIPASSITAVKTVTDLLSPLLPGTGTLAVAGDIGSGGPDAATIAAAVLAAATTAPIASQVKGFVNDTWEGDGTAEHPYGPVGA